MYLLNKSRHIIWLRIFKLEIAASTLGLLLSAIQTLSDPKERAPNPAIPWQL